MKQTYTKPEAMGIIADTLEKAGLYEPIKPYSMEEYEELTSRKNTLAMTGRIPEADLINTSLQNHAPEYIRKLQGATQEAETGKQLILFDSITIKMLPKNT